MSRVLILANEHVSRRMAGPAIRCYEFARELTALGHTVTLASPFPGDLPAQPFAVETYDSSSLERLARRHDVTVMQGFVLDRFPWLRDAAARLVVDLYDPFPLEEMLISAHAPMQARMEVQGKALRAVNDGMRDGDFFLCASEKQRDYWLGALSALNRVNPHTYSDDPTLRALVDVVPFGVPSEPPRRDGPAIRGVLPGVGRDDLVLLWGGGIYAWFDPLTVIRAVAIAARSLPQLRLVFMSTGHPNPEIQEMWTNQGAQRLAAELGLTGRHVFFNADWVPYHRRADWLLDADVGITAHFDHVETRFSFRTRVLDYLWAGLPVICTGGDTLAEVVERRGLGITVPAEDAGAIAAAIEALAADPEARAARGAAAREYAATLTWPAAVAPLARYCADPRPAPDRVAVAPLRRVPLPPSRVPDDAAAPRNGAAPALHAPAPPASETEALRQDLHSLRGHLQSIERSHSFRAAQRASRTVRRVLPAGSPQRTAVGAVARRLGVLPRPRLVAVEDAAGAVPDRGSEWAGRDLAWSRPASRGDLDWQGHLASTAADPVGFAVVVLSESGHQPLQATLESLEAQSWPYWEALVVEPEVVTAAPADPRVRRFHSLEPLATVNRVLESCRSRDLVVVLRGGDTLEPQCLFEAAGAALRDPIVDLVHWDDRVSADGGPGGTARVRPGWSPETLLSANYLDSSFAIRHRRFAAAGGLRPEAGDAAIWDLLLRAELTGEEVIRLPRLLGMLRRDRGRATEAGRRAVDELLARRGWPAVASLREGTVTVRWELERWPRVTVVIPTRHNRALLGPLLDGLAATDYPDIEIVVVDNGRRTPENERWYEDRAGGPPLRVQWWDRPFNYSAVNNAGARDAAGEVLVFLNDDIAVVDPAWLRELVGWATREQIGCVGLQLTAADGSIQHGGVVVGAGGGFAGHLFAGLCPGDDTLLGSTRWLRDVTAVTGACLAIRRELYDRVGGFDERMVLCGSDVALGISAGIGGLRTLCSAATPMRHLESATRGSSAIPQGDFHASYWRYQPLLHGGDPCHSPALSLEGPGVRLRDPSEPTPLDRIGPVLGRSFEVYRQRSDAADSTYLAQVCRATRTEVEAVGALHRRSHGRIDVRTVNWFIPGMDSPFYGGINTAFRIADHLARQHGVANRFVVAGVGPEPYIRAAIAAAFPRLADAEIVFLPSHEDVDAAPEADAAIATLWTTAYQVARAPGMRRKFYLVQDFEPIFYPASTQYALAEESYRLGLYGICNTANLGNIYQRRYGGHAMSFQPAVDTSVFHARGRAESDPAAPPNLFVYARPGHWRNCWELASVALDELKRRLGDRVRIVSAGSWAMPGESDHLPFIRHLGLLDYRATGELYRRCDMGLVLTVSEHPSYLPLELMACGAVPVAFDNPAGHWLLQDGENSILTPRTVDGLADGLERLAVDPALRRRLAAAGLRRMATGHADWARALAPIHDYLSDPEGSALEPAAVQPPLVSGRSRAEV